MNSNTFGNTMDKPIVEVRGLKKYFPIKSSFFKVTVGNVKAVDDVSFDIKAGTTLGVVGESGCGRRLWAEPCSVFIPSPTVRCFIAA